MSENEIKLKEFNFKLLHGILACNRNLKIWKIKTSDHCDICSETQTIKHLLFGCCYVKPLWQLIEDFSGQCVSFPIVLGADTDFKYNRLCTLIAFLIYKEWVILSIEDKSRTSPLSLAHFRSELNLRVKIYERCTGFTEQCIESIKDFSNHLC